MKTRCPWLPQTEDKLYYSYHDNEWGVPIMDEQDLFAKLLLDGAQAGLSWRTILYKRENYYEAFDNFNPELIANYNKRKINQLLKNEGIVRNKLKVNAFVTNAQAYLNLKEEGKDFSQYLWSFVNFKPIQNKYEKLSDYPATSKESDSLSKDLKKRGFKFCGSTIVYAFMQAVGMVNDHSTKCYRHKEVKNLAKNIKF